jgi:hypothetical protein
MGSLAWSSLAALQSPRLEVAEWVVNIPRLASVYCSRLGTEDTRIARSMSRPARWHHSLPPLNWRGSANVERPAELNRATYGMNSGTILLPYGNLLGSAVINLEQNSDWKQIDRMSCRQIFQQLGDAVADVLPQSRFQKCS